MPNFAANISFLYAEVPFLDRFDLAAEAGFQGVEVLYPYDHHVREIQRALTRNDLRMVLMNTPPPNYTGGDRGFAAMAGRETRFQYDMKRVFRYTTALKSKFLHVMSGDASGDEAKALFISNLKWACAHVPKGLTLTIEPLNSKDRPDYFLNDYDLAVEVIKAVGSPKLGLQYDSYHAQLITGDALATFEKYFPYIAHIQVGDAPNRSAPGTGDIDFKALFAAMKAHKYDGWISGEYNAGLHTDVTLNWRKKV